jgi:hypothetical protein
MAAARCFGRDETACLGRQLRRLTRAKPLRQRRRRHVQGSKLLDEELDPLRVRLLVDAVHGRQPLSLQQRCDLLVAEDHQLLDQPVRLRLLNRPSAGDVAVVVEGELRLRRVDFEGAAQALGGERRGGGARDLQRLCDRLRREGAASEHLVELVVVEARVGTDATAVEACRAHLSPGSELDLRGHCEALRAGRQRAGVGAEGARQHRLHGSRHVRAGTAP